VIADIHRQISGMTTSSPSAGHLRLWRACWSGRNKPDYRPEWVWSKSQRAGAWRRL